MIKVYNELVDVANSFVKIIMNHYKDDNKLYNTMGMVGLLTGAPTYVVDINGKGHNYQAVVDGIHNYYTTAKDERIVPLYNDALVFLANHSIEPKYVQETYNIISYELKKEKEGTASFEADIKPALKALANTVDENYSKLSMNKINFAGWYDELNKNLENKYGESIK